MNKLAIISIPKPPSDWTQFTAEDLLPDLNSH